jgi:two-component system sensor histidine kinase UhpB
MHRKNLLTQVLVANLLLMVAAVVATAIAGNPGFDLGGQPEFALVLAFAVALTIIVNVIMLQRRFRPLERLVDEMERVDLSRPRANLHAPVESANEPEEVERLQRAFRRMLERLEAERRRTSSTALAAQEEERTRVARDLHDEVNQSLTALLLRLEAARVKAPVELAHELAETKALANKAMEELLMLARQLRPTALDDLGLKAALSGHVKELGRRGTVNASFDARGDFSGLPADVQLVVYRVAQEALSNAAQHSGADHVQVELTRDGDRSSDRIRLVVGDDGSGFTFDQAARGLGISGMRERALLVEGDVQVESRPGVGTRVSLTVPLESADRDTEWKRNGHLPSQPPTR